MNDSTEPKDFDALRTLLFQVRDTLNGAIVGQETLVSELLWGFFAPGHILLEGPPGLGKTHLAKALAKLLGYGLSRIQCTPDLMPADITGSEMLSAMNTPGMLEFRHGPLFAHVVLVDEINRAAPRTQSAFLEAMQEGQVTHLGQNHKLPRPFWLLATQNPIELEGTYPLPEAQLDRFLLKVIVPYPSSEALLRITDTSLVEEPADLITPLVSAEEVTQVLALVKEVVIAPPVRQIAVDLITATHPAHPGCHPLSDQHVRYGASPRGLLAVLRAAKVAAIMEGRAHVAIEDIRRVALPALRHRVLLNFESEVDGMTSDRLIEEITSDCVN